MVCEVDQSIFGNMKGEMKTFVLCRALQVVHPFKLILVDILFFARVAPCEIILTDKSLLVSRKHHCCGSFKHPWCYLNPHLKGILKS